MRMFLYSFIMQCFLLLLQLKWHGVAHINKAKSKTKRNISDFPTKIHGENLTTSQKTIVFYVRCVHGTFKLQVGYRCRHYVLLRNEYSLALCYVMICQCTDSIHGNVLPLTKHTHVHYLHIRPGPCISELVNIHISCCESLQGLLCFSVIIQRCLLFNEVEKSGFQFCGNERIQIKSD